MPRLDNYTSDQYKKHGKIWDIASANNGIVYMAGDAGLLEFDGKTWSQFKGSKGFTRSLVLANDGLIYTGSDLDFGVWEKNALNQFVYTSLYPFVREPNEENEEFWDVYRLNDKIVFVSFNSIYVYKNKQLTKIAAPSRFSGSFQNKGKIYLADEKNGLYTFNGISLNLLFAYPDNAPFQISGIFDTATGLMLVTKNKGLYLYREGKLSLLANDISTRLRKDQVFCSTAINDAYFAFGTILNGVYITDLDGNIVQHINKQNGLLNNTILSLHYASNGMLWLGMDYGLSAVHLHNSPTYVFDYKGEFGTASTALLKNGVFYLGTNQGLYKTEWQYLNNNASRKPLTLVQGSEGQVWALDGSQETILCGHDKGLFRVEGNTLQKIHDEPGVWTFLSYKDDYLLTGNYNGISVFKKDGNRYSFLKKVALILGSCNQLLVEQNNIFWANIPNFGLIRFSLNNDFDPENRVIFPASLFQGNALHLLKDEKGIQLLTSDYRYRYDRQKSQFLLEGENAPIENIAGVLDGVYRPVRLDSSYQFYPVYNGFALCNTSTVSQKTTRDGLLLVRKIEAYNNHARQLISEGASVPYSLNNLSVHVIVPHGHGVTYQHQLRDYSKRWSEWTTDGSVNFLSLEPGDYTLEIRAKTDGKITPAVAVPFSVLPPWYRTRWAYLAYLLLALMLAYLVRAWQNYRLREQKKTMLKKEQNSLRKLAEKYRQEALASQQQQLEYERNLLKQQVKVKNIELAKQARDNKSKTRLLHILKEKLEEVQHDPSVSKMRWAEMKRLLDLYLETDDKTFEIQIDELHQEFIQKLRERYPDLSVYDLRLCVYLKIGLNSKEISEILKVLPSSINVSRSRLRKKLNLQHDEDLFGFLNQIR